MIKHIHDINTEALLRTEEAEPDHGDGWCKLCGMCLACAGDSACHEANGGPHYWAVYERAKPVIITPPDIREFFPDGVPEDEQP